MDLADALKDTGTTTPPGAGHRRQSSLVVVEMTLAIVLLAGVGLLLRTFTALRTVDRGFDANDVLTVEMPLIDARYQSAAAVTDLVDRVTDRFASLRGGSILAASYSLPFEASVALPFTLDRRPLYASPYHGVGPRQELGIRLALGAAPAALRNMVLAQGGQLTIAGIVIGLAAAAAASRVLQSVVVGLATWDPAVFLSVAALLGGVALAAAYVPARDATRVDPVDVLRR